MFQWLAQQFGFSPPDGPIVGARGRHWKWPVIRAAYLDQHPYCAVCGGTDDCTPHHIRPVHLFPELELDVSNLITLCEGRKSCNCHLEFGHLGNWKLWNPTVITDAESWYYKRACARE